MPEKLTADEVNAQTDPSVTKQFDSSTSAAEQVADLFKLIDSFSACMLVTFRPEPVGRSMSIAKRDGAKLLFLANKNSRKFADLDGNKDVFLTFQNSTKDWVSMSGSATTVSDSDPRIKEIYSPAIAAWFGDLGDGVHTGKADDPRLALIEVTPKHVKYYKNEVSSVGAMAEIGAAAVSGRIAKTGVLRELKEDQLSQGGANVA